MLPLDGDIYLDVGAYTLGDLLEAGPDYTVMSAYNQDLGRDEALKIFHDMDEMDVEVVRAEVRRVAQVQSCGLPRVLGFGKVNAIGSVQPVAIFERLVGTSLATRLASGRTMRPLQVVRLALKLLRVYDELHRVGLAVGPLPADELILNAGIGGERLLVNRYHLGGMAEELDQAAVAPLLSSTPECVAPELFLGGAFSRESDFFSIGVWMYTALVGSPPYSGNAQELMRTFRRDQVELDWPLWAMIPESLCAVVGRALHVTPEARFPTARAFADALEAVPLEALIPGEPAGQHKDIRRGFTPMSSKPGVARPTVWAFVDGPEFRKPNVLEALVRLDREIELVRMGDRERANWLQSLENRAMPAPHAVLFGDMAVLLGDPLLTEISGVVEASRVLVSGHVNADLIESSASSVGLDSFVLADMPVDEIVARIRRAYQRSVKVRSRFLEAGTVPRLKAAERPADAPPPARPALTEGALKLEVLS